LNTNLLYWGDNRDILRAEIPDESVDLIYLDPPFNSKRDYNAIFRDDTGAAPPAQIKAFTDTWKWHMAVDAYQEVVTAKGSGNVGKLLRAMHDALGPNDVMAYLSMMAVRMGELWRVLKPDGSIFLHCDPTASHYLKLLMDAQFGKLNYRNEIIWHYRKWPSGRAQFQRNHDVILFYSKSGSKDRFFEAHLMSRAPSTLKRFGNKRIISGHDAAGRRVPSQMSTEDSPGVWGDDVWDISRVAPVNQRYDTQKPAALLSRIIQAASQEGDIVLDPFAGCGTAVVEAHRANRQWVGIDITYWAIATILEYMNDEFGAMTIPVKGSPTTEDEARKLARMDAVKFEQWVVKGLLGATPTGGKPVDGEKVFVDDSTMKAKRCIVEVTTALSKKHFDAFLHHAEKAEMAVYVLLDKPTTGMVGDAKSAGKYHSPEWATDFPKVQIRTVGELLAGKEPEFPPPYKRKGGGAALRPAQP
jgi:site-specific DNA-methyltransferase (adenine-specific)